MSGALNVLCAGAVKGLVQALEQRFANDAGPEIAARFGAVGAMREALRSGQACDVLIVTDAMVASLSASGELLAGTAASIGRVQTGVAVPLGAAPPAIGTTEALRAALLAASAIHFPDAERSTAGAHFMSVLERLGIRDAVAPQCRMHANGAVAMSALASSGDPGAIGCTQITEIRYTPGLVLVGPLPKAFALATVYAAAVAAGAGDAAAGRRFIALLSGAENEALRLAGGFEVAAIP